MRDYTWPVITHLVGNTGAPSCLRPDPRNERSRRAIMRLGAHLDGVVRADRIALDGAIRDSAVFSFLDSEWPEVKAQLTALLR